MSSAGDRRARDGPAAPVKRTCVVHDEIDLPAEVEAIHELGDECRHALERVGDPIGHDAASGVRQVRAHAANLSLQRIHDTAPHRGRVGNPVQQQERTALALVSNGECCWAGGGLELDGAFGHCRGGYAGRCGRG